MSKDKKTHDNENAGKKRKYSESMSAESEDSVSKKSKSDSSSESDDDNAVQQVKLENKVQIGYSDSAGNITASDNKKNKREAKQLNKNSFNQRVNLNSREQICKFINRNIQK